jgi:hypothetical protein
MKKLIAKTHIPVWLAIVLGIVLILRIPTFFEPFSYGDEMIYLTLGEGIRRGLTLFKDIYDNKPPLLYLLAALAGNVFWFKAILAFWNTITIVLFWHLSQALFPKKLKIIQIATIIFAFLTTIPLLEGHIANAEIFMIGPTIAAFLLLLTRKANIKNLLTAGVLFALAALFKIPAAFDVGAIVVFWLITAGLKREALKETARKTLYLALGFAIPIVFSFLWYLAAGALGDYLKAAFLQNLGYLSSWRGGTTEPFLVRNLPLLIRATVVAAIVVVLYLKKSRLSKQFIFICLWLGFALFAATLSERPYPHYLLQAVGPIAFLLGIVFAEKTIEQSLAIIPLGLALFVPVYYKFWYYSSTPYYLRFINFALGKTDKAQYFASFGERVNRNYQIADFLVKSSSPNDPVFVWGPDGSAIYALARRLPPGKYVIDYHIKDYSSKAEQAELLTQKNPKFIILLPDAEPFAEILPLIRRSYLRILTLDGAEIWKLR